MSEQITRRETVRRGLAATSLCVAAGLGHPGARARRDPRALHRSAGQLQPNPHPRTAHARCPEDRWSVHPQGSVLHHAALRPSCHRPCNFCSESLRAGGAAEVVLARRTAKDAQHGARVRLRVLRQSPSPARSRRATAAGPASRCKAVLDQAGVKPAAREFVFFGADHGEEDVDFRGTSTRWTSSSAAAWRAKRRCPPSRCWPRR